MTRTIPTLYRLVAFLFLGLSLAWQFFGDWPRAAYDIGFAVFLMQLAAWVEESQ